MLVTSLGLATPVHPNAMQGAIFHVRRYRGMFHGEMSPKTPTGDRCSYVRVLGCPSINRTAPSSCKIYVAKYLKREKPLVLAFGS
jgi:hypothetical protein